MATLGIANHFRRSYAGKVNVAAEIRGILKSSPKLTNAQVHTRLAQMRLRSHNAAINLERKKLRNPEATVWARTTAAIKAEAAYYGIDVETYWETIRSLTANDMRLTTNNVHLAA